MKAFIHVRACDSLSLQCLLTLHNDSVNEMGKKSTLSSYRNSKQFTFIKGLVMVVAISTFWKWRVLCKRKCNWIGEYSNFKAKKMGFFLNILTVKKEKSYWT